MGIKVCDLVMEYKKSVKVLNHVNLTIEHGIYGLLGENGAGKTTLMKILVTLLTPTSGTVEINGLTVKPENYEIIKKQIGYLPQEFGLYGLIMGGSWQEKILQYLLEILHWKVITVLAILLLLQQRFPSR